MKGLLLHFAGTGLFSLKCVCISPEMTNSAASLALYSILNRCFVFEITTKLF